MAIPGTEKPGLGFPKKGKLTKVRLVEPEDPNTFNNTAKKDQPQMQKAGNLIICTWNIKRGLVKRELEIKELLKREDIDIIFLTETDIKLSSEDDYQIEGFKTVFQARESQDDVIRLICLIKNKRMSVIRIMDNIMSNSFPSIWLSYEERNKGIMVFTENGHIMETDLKTVK
jgi:hypothetical protein